MSISEVLAKADHYVRPLLHRLPPHALVAFYSVGRRYFGSALAGDIPSSEIAIPTEGLARTMWGIHFRTPLFNAAGMFKYGEGYDLCASLGAGAYLAGTSTSIPRTGNARSGVSLPFCPYPGSRAASNWLGLPNPGHAMLAKSLAGLGRILNTPIGVSVATDPGPVDKGVLSGLTDGLRLFERAGVDFIEMNESCPNVHSAKSTTVTLDSELLDRLEFVQFYFLKRRKRRVPVIVKLSNDTAIEQVPLIVDALATLGFDGVNFGNTSTRYAHIRPMIADSEQPSFDFFTKTFGGGMSGAPLKKCSKDLSSAAVNAVRTLHTADEFHVIRTGGVETSKDIAESLRDGVALVQWYTGFFDQYARVGRQVYAALYKELGRFLHEPAL